MILTKGGQEKHVSSDASEIFITALVKKGWKVKTKANVSIEEASKEVDEIIEKIEAKEVKKAPVKKRAPRKKKVVKDDPKTGSVND